jgi:GTP-binding protein
VTGSAVEKLIAMTDINNPEALHHLHKRLREMGIIKMLKEAGIRDGDFVRIGNFVCNYVDEESEGEPS